MHFYIHCSANTYSAIYNFMIYLAYVSVFENDYFYRLHWYIVVLYDPFSLVKAKYIVFVVVYLLIYIVSIQASIWFH